VRPTLDPSETAGHFVTFANPYSKTTRAIFSRRYGQTRHIDVSILNKNSARDEPAVKPELGVPQRLPAEPAVWSGVCSSVSDLLLENER